MIKISKTSILGACLMFSCATTLAQQKQKFIDPANMDRSVKPGNDFYEYASGTWVKNNPVPAKETRWGSFNVLRDFNINAVKSILEKASADKNAPAGSVEKRVGDFYAAAMDSATIEKLGYTPIKADLAAIDGIRSIDDVLKTMNYLRRSGIASALYGFYVGQDKKNVEVMIPQLSQGGTSLPDRDNYLKDDKRSVEIRAAYAKYITTLFSLTGTGETTAAANAATIFAMEKQLAQAQLSRVEMRDAYKTYNKFFVDDLSKTTPGLDWKTTLAELNVKGQDSVLVNNPAFFVTAAQLLRSTPLNDWKVYLKWSILKNAASKLSSSFVKANFAFSQALSGQKYKRPAGSGCLL